MSSVFAKLSAVFLSSVLSIGTSYGAYQTLQDSIPADFLNASASTSSASASFLGGIDCDIDCMNDFAELAGVMVDYYRERKYRATSVSEGEHSHVHGSEKGTSAAGAKPQGDSNPLDLDPLFEGRALLRRPAYTTPVVVAHKGSPVAVILADPPAPEIVIYV